MEGVSEFFFDSRAIRDRLIVTRSEAQRFRGAWKGGVYFGGNRQRDHPGTLLRLNPNYYIVLDGTFAVVTCGRKQHS